MKINIGNILNANGKNMLTAVFAAIMGIFVTACGGGGGGSSGGGTPPPASTYTVGGVISGLKGTLVLQDNGADGLSESANGSFTFSTALTSGASYAVTVSSQPAGQTCKVSDGSGTVTGAVSSVAVSCVTTTSGSYTVGGTVSGLLGTGLILLDNGADQNSVNARTVGASASSFTFSGTLASGAAYSVSVQTQPSNPAQNCVISGGTGTVTTANINNIAVNCTNLITGMVLTGSTQGTNQGIGGEIVTLYDATSPTSGLGAGTKPLPLGTTTTAADGSFTVAVSSSLCPATASGAYDVVYALATPGSSNSTSPIRFMSVVGPCAALVESSSQSVGVINELTTVGAIYALNGFIGYDGEIIVGNTEPANGLPVAVATYGALVSDSLGSVTANLASTQSAAANTLNALANSLAACTQFATTGSSGTAGPSPCSSLFSAATLPGFSPADTFSAALNVAHYPGMLGDIYDVASASPYAPTLSAAPNDWTLVETYANVGGLSNPQGLAIDSVGNIWVVNNFVASGGGSSGSLSMFGSTGAALNNNGITSSNTFFGPERIAIGVDNTGAEAGWITNMPYSENQSGTEGPGRVIQFELNNTLSNCSVTSSTCALAYAPGSVGNVQGANAGFAQPQGIAIDGDGNAWIASLYQTGSNYAAPGSMPGVLTEISGGLTASTPFNNPQDSSISNGGPQYQDVGIDGQGNLWALDGANGLLQEFNPNSGTWLNGAGFATGFDEGFGINAGYAPQVGNQLAIDPNGNVWVAQSSNTEGTLPGFNASGLLPNLPTESDLQAPNAIAVDGAGNIFVVNAGNNSGNGTCLVEIGIMQGSSNLQDLSYNTNTQSTCGLGNSAFYDTYGLAIDQAGNLWAVNYDGPSSSGSLVEVVGAAFPTMTPLDKAVNAGSTSAARGHSKDRTRR